LRRFQRFASKGNRQSLGCFVFGISFDIHIVPIP
jgi:hypothetical protein